LGGGGRGGLGVKEKKRRVAPGSGPERRRGGEKGGKEKEEKRGWAIRGNGGSKSLGESAEMDRTWRRFVYYWWGQRGRESVW